MGLMEEADGRGLDLRGARWSKMADTLKAKRAGGARTRRAPRKMKKERANSRIGLETARVK